MENNITENGEDIPIPENVLDKIKYGKMYKKRISFSTVGLAILLFIVIMFVSMILSIIVAAIASLWINDINTNFKSNF